MKISKTELERFIVSALAEDIGDGDHTSLATVPEDAVGRARLLVKDQGVIAGVELAKFIFEKVDPDLRVDVKIEDGQDIKFGDEVFYVEGRDRSILAAERLVLNCMQRMSGIATVTHDIVKKLEGTGCKVLDTRKTTPGFRLIEKWAVKIGGGENHRFGLFDMILIKDNHVDYAGGIEPALAAAQAYLKQTEYRLKIELEVRNHAELDQALAVGMVDRIMLDNFKVEDLKAALKKIGDRFETEASGGITPETIRSFAETGVNYVSMGYLTHSIKSLDLSLKAVK